MTFYGFGADCQQGGDLLGAVPFGDEFDDVGFARSDRSATRPFAAGETVEVAAHQRRERCGIDERLAAKDGAGGGQNVAVGLTLQHVACCSGRDGFEEVLLP